MPPQVCPHCSSSLERTQHRRSILRATFILPDTFQLRDQRFKTVTWAFSSVLQWGLGIHTLLVHQREEMWVSDKRISACFSLSFKENRAYIIRVKEPRSISLFPDILTSSLSFGSKDKDIKKLQEITVETRNMGDVWLIQCLWVFSELCV